MTAEKYTMDIRLDSASRESHVVGEGRDLAEDYEKPQSYIKSRGLFFSYF